MHDVINNLPYHTLSDKGHDLMLLGSKLFAITLMNSSASIASQASPLSRVHDKDSFHTIVVLYIYTCMRDVVSTKEATV